MIILDTNVLSEVTRALPSTAVAGWLSGQRRADIACTAVTRAEMLAGVAVMPEGKRRQALRALIDALFESLFGEALLPFDAAAADRYAEIVATRQHSGRPIATLDAQIAAIALVHGAVVATRDVDGFAGIGLELINPWTG
jgi:predicted nucleic acid-binding protein